MAQEDKPLLLGVCVAPDSFNSDKTDTDGTNLGFVVVQNQNVTAKKVKELILQQLEPLPGDFKFFTRQRWPVQPSQEDITVLKHLINSRGVICIQFDHGGRKVGVVSADGTALGFIFIEDIHRKVSWLRNKINIQLQENPDIKDGPWVFLDTNSWPLSQKQEDTLSVVEIMSESSVQIKMDRFAANNTSWPLMDEFSDGKSSSPPNKVSKIYSPNINSGGGHVLYSQPHSLGQLSAITEKDSPVKKSKAQAAKQILISYVRAEASQYALDLKTELENLNFSVYLDVHEIFCGLDWQDSLNFAVSNCEVFVPLVTPRYGETQWTNREVKLADVLNKFIVPVCFLKTWPPRCLAIQFATTQFINWKMTSLTKYPSHGTEQHQEGEDGKVRYIWDRPDVNKVAKEIGKRCHREARKRREASKNADNRPKVLLRGLTMNRSDLVILSVHPSQAEFSSEVRELLEGDGMQVWCTLDMNYQNGHGPDSDDTDHVDSDGEVISSSQANREVLFQEKVEAAGAIIFVLSEAFANSDSCKQQVFYCEQRKPVVPLKYEAFEMPGWMSMLIGTNTFEDRQRGDFRDSLVARVKRAVDSDTVDDMSELATEAQINACVDFLCKKLPETDCVYIAGGTKFFYSKSAEICKAVGTCLAKLHSVTCVTGGFYGVGETVSKAFYEERSRSGSDPDVWHILPVRDEQDRSAQARMNPDKTFQTIPFGTTLFCGESVRQRETVISRVFDICILIEGGPGAAHEAEEFTWSDHTVIPISCTGGAAGGKFKVPEKIFEVPPGVSADDWQKLGEKSVSPEEIGEAVARIVSSLLHSAASQMTCKKSFYKRPTVGRSRSFSSNY